MFSKYANIQPIGASLYRYENFVKTQKETNVKKKTKSEIYFKRFINM